jgi:molybdopterin-containing oxidoreductase family iron-sulfur binding subunit
MSHDVQPGDVREERAGEQPGPTRRDFLKGLGLSAGLLAAGVVPAVASGMAGAAQGAPAVGTALAAGVPGAGTHVLDYLVEEDGSVNYPGHTVSYAPPVGDEKWAMVIDVKMCVGCRKCVYACVKENNIGRTSGFTYIQVLEMEQGSMDVDTSDTRYADGGNPEKWYMPVQCMHCAKPTCVYGCPVKATWKDPDGIVLVDYDKCIACRNCIVTCPYFARHFNWVDPYVPKNEINPAVPLEAKKSVVEKCTFCVQRTRNGLNTACTEACPVGARTFGNLADPKSAVAELIRTRRAFRMKEELGNEPMIWYVG